MASLNKVQLIGNVGRDPEVRTMQNGGRVVNFSVATSEQWNDKSTGEKRERTEWHNVVIFDERLVDLTERYVKKGDKIFVEGQMQTRKWQDQSGADRYTTEVVLNRFRGQVVLLGGSSSGRTSDLDSENAGSNPAPPSTPEQPDLDDEIPFD